MYEVGIRQAVLTAIKAYVGAQEKAMEKARLLEAPTEPTAPPMEPGTKEKKEGEKEPEGAAAALPVEATVAPAGYTPNVTVRVNTECVICMERDVSQTVLLPNSKLVWKEVLVRLCTFA